MHVGIEKYRTAHFVFQGFTSQTFFKMMHFLLQKIVLS